MIKVSIIGAGSIGSNIAYRLAQSQFYDIHLVDKPDTNIAEGKSLDLMHSLAASNISCPYRIYGSNDIKTIRNSDIVIITAGESRTQNSGDRNGLMRVNADIIKEIALKVKAYAKNSFVIVVTNPVDSMAWYFQKISGMSENRVVGMAGTLDTARFRFFLSQELDLDMNDIQAMVIGPHDDHMMPLLRYTNISGIPLREFIKKGWITEETLLNVIQKTKKAGSEIVSLLKDKSAYYAPAESVVKIVESYALNQRRVLVCSVNLGIFEEEKDLCIGLPVVIGSNGIEAACPLEFEGNEEEEFRKSIKAVMQKNFQLTLISDSKKNVS